MRRILLVLVAGTILLGAGAPNATADGWRQDECRFQSLHQATWTAREERLTAKCAIDHWSVPGGYAKLYSVGDCESGWNRFANNAGRYLGLFQHSESYWQDRVNAYEPTAWEKGLSERWTNSRTQIIVTARMAHRDGWGPWRCA